MTLRLLTFACALALGHLTGSPASAQLAPPNAGGVAIGHVHINATDVDAQSRF